mmetsp:Transcript_37599/g.49496  ORF Transcript_37599/g.49496 Transcript_37599/m.49496 type:complete len:155 (-) Transcript_37599:1021-1485(-)|eukprot:CAMPEP_0185584958 /NCGR_PEP_ID=MMETSP0434-20130131/35569_1 /TAXON_ID=626734 ORGANISM="Favella taraikaensis, Strain Fe Narragansett Bay" /NCGR_SAMPLE_ID=MMETSP0434 /ASSEMBLY_ACC=CAM_ASM_000379 /LENGTH=154 /DNA_ID=CAMNT_0028205017 /DNA_START=53 /DNA_END=517 /DNA_ORIENTATION=+
MRVEFSYIDGNFAYENRSKIKGVYCTDYFSEQIAAEKNGTANDDFLTKSFTEDKNVNWICPDLKTIDLNSTQILEIRVLACGEAEGDAYADAVECDNDPLKVVEYVKLDVMVISSNFAPNDYLNGSQLQRFAQHNFKIYDASYEIAHLDIRAST